LLYSGFITGGPPGNQAPTAAYTYSCTGLQCSFDGGGSSDPDGTIASYAWTFGDGTTGTGVTTSHAYASAGTRTVTLTVTDNAGATGSTSKSVSVTDPGAFPLSARGYKVKGNQRVDLTWSGATGSNVDVYRNGVKVITTANDGFHTDPINKKGSATYTHKVCQAGTSVCSNTTTTTF
jgi:PKD repeat protein